MVMASPSSTPTSAKVVLPLNSKSFTFLTRWNSFAASESALVKPLRISSLIVKSADQDESTLASTKEPSV
jgi:hypothetical protein